MVDLIFDGICRLIMANQNHTWMLYDLWVFFENDEGLKKSPPQFGVPLIILSFGELSQDPSGAARDPHPASEANSCMRSPS